MKSIIIFISFIVILNLSATIINIPADQPTIQEGINVAVDGDTVLVHPGAYIENINFNGKEITVASLFFTTQDTTYISQTIIDGNESESVVLFNNEESSEASLIGLTIINGYNENGGGIYCWYSNPKLINNIFMNNNADDSGGAIYIWGANPVIENNTFTNNYSNEYGGAIYCIYGAEPQISNNTFTNNESYYGGAITCIEYSNALIQGNIIDNNLAFRGGGIFCYLFSNPIIENNIISNNIADGENQSPGGGIFIDSASPIISENNIYQNFANRGAGIFCTGLSEAIIINNFIQNNDSDWTGGGGIFCNSQLELKIIQNVITGNNSEYYGGGIYCYSSSPLIVNNTISENYSYYHGGGIYCEWYSSPIIYNTIFWGNEYGWPLNNNQVYLNNDNCNPFFYYCDIQDGFNGFGGGGAGANYDPNNYQNNIQSNPIFVSSTDWSLQAISPCINAGILDTSGLYLPELDIAGNPRIVDNIIDIGAYEYQDENITDISDVDIASFSRQYGNYPNPFNPTTNIYFTLIKACNVNIEIFNIKGRIVKKLINNNMDIGYHSILWDGTSDNNKQISSGIYFYKIIVNGETKTLQKCILLK